MNRMGGAGVFTATVVLACLVLVLVAAAAVVHCATPSDNGDDDGRSAGPCRCSRFVLFRNSANPGGDRCRRLCHDLGHRARSSSLATFPTPSNVEKIINPYMSSLQLYGTLLSGSTAPAPARSDAANAEAQVHQDLRFLDTIDALPPLQLGAFLKQFDIDATQLQTTLSALEQNLRTTTS